jgi:hypothetical protein
VPIEYEKQNVFYPSYTITKSGCVGWIKDVLFLYRSMSLMCSVLSLYRGHAMGLHSLLPLGCAPKVLDQVLKTLTCTSNSTYHVFIPQVLLYVGPCCTLLTCDCMLQNFTLCLILPNQLQSVVHKNWFY